MGLLDSLALGLRSAGGVLNKNVETANQQEMLQEEAKAEQRKNLIASLAIKAAENGSASPQAVQETLGRLGVQVPSEFVGPSAETQARQQALKNEQAFRTEWSNLPPNASMLERASIATKYGKADLSVQMYNAEQNRLAQAEARRAALEQRQFELEQRLQDKALDREQRATLAAQSDETRRLIAAQTAELQRGNQDLRRELMQFQLKDKTDKELSQKVMQLQKNLEKANLPEADSTLAKAEDLISAKPDIAEWVAGPKSKIPDFMAPKEVTDARQAFAKVFNITLKNRSGSAVTNQELERLKQEYAAGAFKKPEQLVEALNQARWIIQKHYASVAAGFGNDALRTYNENIKSLGGRIVLEAPQAASGSGEAPSADPLGIRK